MRIKGIRHTCITVQNMESMIAFYQNLGMTKIVRCRVEEGGYLDSSMGLIGVKALVVYLQAEDGSLLELIKMLTHDKDYSHISYTVEGLDDAKQSPYNKVKAKFLKDPEGHWMECVELV